VDADITLILMLVIGLGSLLGIVGLLVAKPARAPGTRLDSLAGESAPAAAPAMHHSATPTIAPTQDEQSRRQLAERLIQAGLYRRNSKAYYVFVKILLASLVAGIGVAAAMFGVLTLFQGVLCGAIAGLLATVLPSFWLDIQKRKRQTALRRALPDALDVIVVCVEAGLSVPAAITRVSRELKTAHPMLATEMVIVEREIQMGYSTGEAIQRFAGRFDLEELRSLASVILQAQKFGASISQALRVHAEGLRTKRFQLAEEKAQKASIKLLFPTIFCIFPALFVVLIGPAVFDIYKFLVNFSVPLIPH
jgi:tight adherence protein C